MSSQPRPTEVVIPPQVEYVAPDDPLPPGTIGAIHYGGRADAASEGACRVAVGLEPVQPGSGAVEAWISRGVVRAGNAADLRYAETDDHLYGAIELDESQCGGLYRASLRAYANLVQFFANHSDWHPWRLWNFLDAANEGTGDDERYREFCRGRADGIGTGLSAYPAASALGRRDGRRVLQVIVLAGRCPATLVENPRQVSAFRYPRRYGPASPSFSRAAVVAGNVLISGTASIVGHETLHAGDVAAQTRESLANLVSVSAASGIGAGRIGALKAYVRNAADVPTVRRTLEAAGHDPALCCFLLADICRRDLLVEFEAVATR